MIFSVKMRPQTTTLNISQASTQSRAMKLVIQAQVDQEKVGSPDFTLILSAQLDKLT